MPAFIIGLVILLLSGTAVQGAADDDHTPKLLLNAKRLRRLKRDSERQTQRWLNFERRVKTVPDSPERGFELALYYAVTGDPASSKDAATWAGRHPCEVRQVSLIADWVGSQIPPATKHCVPKGSELERLRDGAFLAIASAAVPQSSPQFIPAVTQITFETAGPLYAAIEYLDAIRSATRDDLREEAVTYFSNLPSLFLLSLPPARLSDPGWQMHAAALALVSLDPNLEGSQFLQSWAMESPQTVQEGAGVAYEWLWADPYLPGVSYRNMEPALYDEAQSRLIARAGWEDDACRIEIKPGSINSTGCPPDWQTKRMEFGRLSLIPMQERCVDLGRQAANETTILWKLRPRTKLLYAEGDKEQWRDADAAGMWRASAEFHGKACMAK